MGNAEPRFERNMKPTMLVQPISAILSKPTSMGVKAQSGVYFLRRRANRPTAARQSVRVPGSGTAAKDRKFAEAPVVDKEPLQTSAAASLIFVVLSAKAVVPPKLGSSNGEVQSASLTKAHSEGGEFTGSELFEISRKRRVPKGAPAWVIPPMDPL